MNRWRLMLDARFYVKNASIVYINFIYESLSENNTPKSIIGR